MPTRLVSGHGLATLTPEGAVLDVWYPAPALGEAPAHAPAELRDGEGMDAVRGVRTQLVTTSADLDADPSDAADVYLRLHALSHRLVAPNEVNLEGIFGLLQTVAWTSLGPCAVDGLAAVRARARAAGTPLQVTGVDKFPRMADYVVPSGVRIGDADRVRLGAHLAQGTVVMPEGFVNFNAGTLGPSMVEGRVSQGVVIGAGTDIGGGASIMGTLSGGGTERISLGERCLLGANAGLGIALGDDCVVEAGLYLTAGTKVTVLPSGGVTPDDGRFPQPQIIAARRLSGRSNMLFRRNSTSGVVEVLGREGHGVELNDALHS